RRKRAGPWRPPPRSWRSGSGARSARLAAARWITPGRTTINSCASPGQGRRLRRALHSENKIRQAGGKNAPRVSGGLFLQGADILRDDLGFEQRGQLSVFLLFVLGSENLAPHRHGARAVAAHGLAAVDRRHHPIQRIHAVILAPQQGQVGGLALQIAAHRTVAFALAPMTGSAVLQVHLPAAGLLSEGRRERRK